MKKLISALVLVALVAACHHASPETSSSPAAARSNVNGAADALSALRSFLAAAKQTDLQAMGAIFGDAGGPARDAIGRDELEKREIIMARCLRHDRYDVVGDAPSPGGGRSIAVNLTYGKVSRSTNFEIVRGPSSRWYVQKFDIQALNEICIQK
jgi:hypothetical protein